MIDRPGSSVPADLLQATISDSHSVAPPPGQRPWGLANQFYVAFLGGTAAISMLAYMNAVRLGMSQRMQNAVLLTGIGVVLVAGVLTVTVGFSYMDSAPSQASASRGIRLANRIVALLLFALFYRWQLSAFRRYTVNFPNATDSMWKWGIISCVAGSGITVALTGVLNFVLRG